MLDLSFAINKNCCMWNISSCNCPPCWKKFWNPSWIEVVKKFLVCDFTTDHKSQTSERTWPTSTLFQVWDSDVTRTLTKTWNLTWLAAKDPVKSFERWHMSLPTSIGSGIAKWWSKDALSWQLIMVVPWAWDQKHSVDMICALIKTLL